MGVKVRQKGGKWYVCINRHGQRKAKCVGERKLDAKPWILMDTRAKGLALPWPVGWTPQEGRRDEMQLQRN
jgi:hypothetical protein